MKLSIKSVISWAIALWASKVFLSSLPYKFTNHPDTQHIFGTIGEWLKGFLGDSIGNLFISSGAYLVGSFELITSIILLLPALLWFSHRKQAGKAEHTRAKFHALGGLLATGVMAGAVFFHLFSPLGIEVLHEGKSDGGSLFYAALSILILGFILFLMNAKALLNKP